MNINQKKAISDISGNLGTAWLSIGIITKIIFPSNISTDPVIILIISFSFFVFHLFLSVIILKR
jgi:hypothetical protein